MGFSIAGVGNAFPAQDRVAERLAGTAGAQTSENRARPVDPVDIASSARELEQLALTYNRRLKFIVGDNLEDVVVKVIDTDTDKVIKEIPPKELQNLRLHIKEMIGLLHDEKA